MFMCFKNGQLLVLVSKADISIFKIKNKLVGVLNCKMLFLASDSLRSRIMQAEKDIRYFILAYSKQKTHSTEK